MCIGGQHANSTGADMSAQAMRGIKQTAEGLTSGHSSSQKNAPSTAQPSFLFLSLGVFLAAFLG